MDLVNKLTKNFKVLHLFRVRNEAIIVGTGFFFRLLKMSGNVAQFLQKWNSRFDKQCMNLLVEYIFFNKLYICFMYFCTCV